MNRDEFERLRLRFGDDSSRWPAPYAQEARQSLRQAVLGADDGLDRLILEAANIPTDDPTLAGKVLARIEATERRRMSWSLDLKPWAMPATAASVAVVLTISVLGGYIAAQPGSKASEDALLAFAVGVPPSELTDPLGAARSDGGRL